MMAWMVMVTIHATWAIDPNALGPVHPASIVRSRQDLILMNRRSRAINSRGLNGFTI